MSAHASIYCSSQDPAIQRPSLGTRPRSTPKMKSFPSFKPFITFCYSSRSCPLSYPMHLAHVY